MVTLLSLRDFLIPFINAKFDDINFKEFCLTIKIKPKSIPQLTRIEKK